MTEPAPESPVDPGGLVVSTAELARRAGIDRDANHQALVDAILDAQADVVGYLHRAITPTEYTETGLYPVGDEWPLTPLDEPVIDVTTVVAETDADGAATGYFTVTYLAGLDAANDPALAPIRRYVLVHALNSPAITRLWQEQTNAKGEVRSISAEGQSISYGPATLGGGGEAGSNKPGALPTLGSLSYWKRHSVYQRRTSHYPGEWPYRSLDTLTGRRTWG